MNETLIFGSKGYIGGKMKEVFPDAACPDTDIADQAAVRKVLDECAPKVVINAAGKTGRPNVDWCEDHKQETLRSNVTGPLLLLEECLARGIYFVHIGSGCIYQGDNNGKGFTEEDIPNFTGSFYSFTKFLSDQALQYFPVLQLRLRMPFEGQVNPRNFITKITKYSRVLDTKNSLTYLPDLQKVAKTLIERRATGIYNVTNPGGISPYDVMVKYKELVDPSHAFERLSLQDLHHVAKTGRSNCIPSTKKLEQEGLRMMDAEKAIDEALRMMASKS